MVSAHATHVASAKATRVTAAKAAAHVASAKPATVSSAATAAAGLCTRGKQAAGKHRACQNHHHSSSHDILHRYGRTFRHRAWPDVDLFRQVNANAAMDWRWECLPAVATKFEYSSARTGHMRAPDQRRCKKIGRRALASSGSTKRRAPSTRQPHDIASGDRRGCSEADLGLLDRLHH
jgi:hypothetical protein